jgi:hypothetical protein
MHRLALVLKTPLLVAVGLFLSGASVSWREAGGSMALSAALWTALYALNEATDRALERGEEIGQGIFFALILLPWLITMAGIPLSPLLTVYMGLMTAGQIAYCLTPFRLKRYWWAVLILGGAVNPILRIQCGAMWGPHPISPSVYLTIIFLHLGAALRSRVLLRDRDRGFGYKVTPPFGEAAGKALTGAGLAGIPLLCAAGKLPLIFLLFWAIGCVYALYAWSEKITRRSQIRSKWPLFALFCVSAVAALLLAR